MVRISDCICVNTRVGEFGSSREREMGGLLSSVARAFKVECLH